MKLKKYIFQVTSTVMFCSFAQLLFEIYMRDDLKLLENLGLRILLALSVFCFSSVHLFVLLLKKNQELKKNKEKKEFSYDEEYIQEYIKTVGTYLGTEEKERNLYSSVAAGIYLHTPHES